MKSLQFKCEKHHFGGQIIFAIVSTLWKDVEDSVFFSSCFHSKCCVKNWTAIKSISLRAWSKICTNRKPQKDFRAPKHPNLEQIKSHFPEPLNRDSECSIWGLVLVFFFFFFFCHFPLDGGWLLVKVGRPQWKLGFPPHRCFLTLGFLCRRKKLPQSVCPTLWGYTGKKTHEHRWVCVVDWFHKNQHAETLNLLQSKLIPDRFYNK